MTVHPGLVAVEEYGPGDTAADGVVQGTAGGWRERDEYDSGAFADDAEHPVAVSLAEVGDVRPGGLEDAEPEQAEHDDQGRNRIGWSTRGLRAAWPRTADE